MLAVVGVVLGVLARAYDTFPLDVAVMEWVQTIGPGYAPVAEVTNEGNAIIALSLFAVGAGALLRRGRPDAALVFLIVAGMRPYLNELKEYVDRPRPVGDFPVLDVVGDSSFPSGHVMTAVVFLGCWFVFAPEIVPRRFVLPVRVVSVAGVGLYAVARMWAGVHWFSDTYGGLIWSAALLAIVLALRPVLSEVCNRAADTWRAQRQS